MKGTKGCKSTLKVYMRLYKIRVYLFHAKNTYFLGEIKKFHKFKLKWKLFKWIRINSISKSLLLNKIFVFKIYLHQIQLIF